MATATAELQTLLKDMEDPRKYFRRDGVIVFDEHDEYNRRGMVVRSFDKPALLKIAAVCNKREAQGTLCPLTIGHTLRGEPELAQPGMVGYARRFGVTFDKELDRFVLTSTFYIRQDRLAKAREFPRVSVEIWPDDFVIDPISLLIRTPERDIKQWTYAREDDRSLTSSYPETRAMETPITPAAPPPMPERAPDHAERLEQYMRHCQSHPHAKYMAHCYGMDMPAPPAVDPAANPSPLEKPIGNEVAQNMATPSPTNMKVPKPEDEPERNSREARENELVATVRQLQAQVNESNLRYQRAERRNDLTDLLDSGYVFDLEEELAEVESKDPEAYSRHLAKIRRCYSHAMTGEMIQTGDPAQYAKDGRKFVTSQNELTQDGVQEVIRYQAEQQKKGVRCEYQEAREAIIKQYGRAN